MRTQSPPLQHKRPRGLWRGRRGAAGPTCAEPKLGTRSHDPYSDPADSSASASASASSISSDAFEDDFDDDHSSDSSCKRRRLSGALSDSDTLWHQSPSSRALTPDLLYHAPCFPSQILNPPPYPATSPYPYIMFPVADKFSSINTKAKGKQSSVTDLEDWENLKELFNRANESYESDELSEALPLLRAVIRECHRFLLAHPDPSRVYTEQESPRSSLSPALSTPLDERPLGDWTSSYFDTNHRPHRPPRPAQHSDPPTAFHAIFGTALFLMGTVIAQDANLALPDEPPTASTYWLAALDVFETGENLPSVVSAGSPPREDWRMAVSWGRTLVCLAEEKVEANLRASKVQAPPPPFPPTSDPRGAWCSYQPSSGPFASVEPRWPRHSPFHAIAVSRPPVTRRMSLFSASAHDVMVLAMDQFSRGIFHMPHPQYPPTHNPTSLHHEFPFVDGVGFSSAFYSRRHTLSTSPPPSTTSTGSGVTSTFSRPKELFTIASEVLGVAERLAQASQREYWAGQADSVFNQMKMEADMSEWRMAVNAARGRCWLVVGAARAEEMEPALDRGDMSVLHSAEAQEAREGLAMAITFFERAKGSATAKPNPDQEDLSPLLAEALINLANLTADENNREELYSRAQAEGGEDIDLELDPPATALPASISSIAAAAKSPTISASEMLLNGRRKRKDTPGHNPVLSIEASPSFVFAPGTKRSFSFSTEAFSPIERDVPMTVEVRAPPDGSFPMDES